MMLRDWWSLVTFGTTVVFPFQKHWIEIRGILSWNFTIAHLFKSCIIIFLPFLGIQQFLILALSNCLFIFTIFKLKKFWIENHFLWWILLVFMFYERRCKLLLKINPFIWTMVILCLYFMVLFWVYSWVQ